MNYEIIEPEHNTISLPVGYLPTQLDDNSLEASLAILKKYLDHYNETSYAAYRDKKQYLPERNVNRNFFVIDLPDYDLRLLPVSKSGDNEVWIQGSYSKKPTTDSTCYTSLYHFDAKVSLAMDTVYEFYHNNPIMGYDSSADWTLIWQDQFDNEELDPEEWIPLERGDNYNNEKQAYTANNIVVDRGLLKLIGKKEPWEGKKTSASNEIIPREYTSGEVRTRRCWTYGRFVARMKCVDSKGLIAAFWMTTAREEWPPEIDIAEILGNDPTMVYFSNHFGDQENHLYESGSHAGDNLADGFHEFALEWEPTSIRWYMDNKLLFETRKNIPNQPFYLRLSLPIGADWSGNPVDPNLHQEMEVDWVKVYNRCNR